MIPMLIHILEMLPTEQRALMGMVNSYLWAISIMTIPLVAFLMRNFSWRMMQIAFAGFHAFAFFELL
jgi:hypothetical protein